MADVDYTEVGWIAASDHRLTVAEHIATEGPKKPTTIAEETDLHASNVSRALGNLRDRGLVELLVSEDTQKGRIYGACERLAPLVDAAGDV